MLSTLIETVPPRVDGSRVVMTLPTNEAQLAKLRQLTGEATDAALESTRRQQRMQQFKQIALALLTCVDANKHLPPPAISDQNGRRLLSWRVVILPCLEQNDLYKQFHLDEPWDSPHNLALARSMPEVYGDSGHPELAREGKTTYAGRSAGTVFDSKGASRTAKSKTARRIQFWSWRCRRNGPCSGPNPRIGKSTRGIPGEVWNAPTATTSPSPGATAT